jgi:hypothetical protein
MILGVLGPCIVASHSHGNKIPFDPLAGMTRETKNAAALADMIRSRLIFADVLVTVVSDRALGWRALVSAPSTSVKEAQAVADHIVQNLRMHYSLDVES